MIHWVYNDQNRMLKSRLPACSVGNSHRSAGPRPTTLEEPRELFVDFSSILGLWFEIQGMRTYNILTEFQALSACAIFKEVKNSTLTPFTNIIEHGLTLIPAWVSNHIHYQVWDEITYPFPNFNSCTVEVWEWISNFIPHSPGCIITNPCWD